MTSTLRKERRHSQIQSETLAAARKLLKTEGPEALTIRRLADALDYSPASLYEYFASKEHIVVALRQQIRLELLSQLHKIDSESLTAEDYLKALCKEMLTYRLDDEHNTILSLKLPPESYKTLPDDVIQIRTLFDKALQGLKLKGLKEEKQRHKAIFMLRALVEGIAGITLRGELPKQAISAQYMGDEMLNILIKGWK
ncbi:MAG: helix-turn-helix domain-containing protein [Chlamydiales bacterium]|nr:helix-turn-helix domain-containing protein [Chlamydiales bacterium]